MRTAVDQGSGSDDHDRPRRPRDRPWSCARSRSGARFAAGSGSWSTSSSTATRRCRSSTSPRPSTSPTSCATGRPPASVGRDSRQVHPQVHVLRPRKWLPRVRRTVRRPVARAPGGRRPSTTSGSSIRWCGSTTPPTPGSRCRPAGRRSTTSPTTGCWHRSPPRRAARLRADDDLLLERSGAVVVCSPDLARTRGARRDVDLIPNGVDVDLFRTPQARPAELPPSPVAVYVGTLHEERIDVPLAGGAGRGPPGPARSPSSDPTAWDRQPSARLAERPSSTCSGPVPTTGCPAFLQHADVVDHPPPGQPVHREPRPDQGLRVPGRRSAHRGHPGGRVPRARRARSWSVDRRRVRRRRGRAVLDASAPPVTGPDRPRTCPPGGERAEAMDDVMQRVRAASEVVVTTARTHRGRRR